MKDSFYFPHEYSARNDDKLLEIRNHFGNEGYAVFFYCLETMAERGDGYILPSLIGGLSLGYGVAKDWLLGYMSFCVEIGLFELDEKGYYSKKLIEHLNLRKMLKEKGKEGADKRWGNRGANGTPIERKEKERKEKNIKPLEPSAAPPVGAAIVTDNEFSQVPLPKVVKVKAPKKGGALTDVQKLVLHFHKEWARNLGSKTSIHWGEEGACASRVLKDNSLEELCALATDYFAYEDKNYWRFAHFCSMKDRLKGRILAAVKQGEVKYAVQRKDEDGHAYGKRKEERFESEGQEEVGGYDADR